MADGSVKIDIVADDSDIKKTLDGVGSEAEDAAGGLDKLGDSADNAGKDFGAADVAIGSFVANGISALVSKVGDAIGSIIALADETREYREDMAKLDSAFTTAGHSTETAQKAYDGFYKILGESDRTVEAVNHLAEMTKNEEELAQWSTICAGVTARFGDSLPIEGLTEAANETAKVGQVTGPLADALNWAGISEDEFNEKLAKCNSEQERASLITSTLNKEYEAAAAEYNELTANTQAARDATNKMEQAQAALGAAIEPVTTAWTNMKANALQWFVDVGLPGLQKGWQWIQDNIPTIAVIVGGLTAAWLAFGGAQTILNTVQTAGIAIQTALNAVMNANPIGLIILAITALVAGFMLLWKNCEGFRNFWKGLWEGIKTAAKAVADWFKTAWTATLDWFKNAVAKIKEFFTAAWEGVKKAFDNTIIGNYFKAVWETIKGIFAVVKAVLSGNWSDAWEAIKNIVNTWRDYFADIWEKIKAVFSVVKDWFGDIFTAAWEAIKGVLSTWKDFFSNVWEGIKSVFSVVKDWFTNIFTSAWNGIKNAWSSVKSFFSGIWSGITSVFSSVKTWFSQKFTEAKDAIVSAFSNIIQKFTEIKNNIFNVFSGIKEKFLTIGTNIVQGIWQGISNGYTWITNKISSWVGDVLDFFKKKLGIKSPSRVFRDEVGVMISRGVAVGIEKGENEAVKTSAKLIQSIWKKVDEEQRKGLKTISDFKKDELDLVEKHNAELQKADFDFAKSMLENEEKFAEDLAKKKKELADLDEKLLDDMAKQNADVVKLDKEYKEKVAEINEEIIKLEKGRKEDEKKILQSYNAAIEKENERHATELKKVYENISGTITEQMEKIVSLSDQYKADTQKIWTELETSIADAQENYASQLESRTASIANSLNLWDKATKNDVSANQLQRNLQSQIRVLEHYNDAIAKLEERNVNEAFLNQLKEMGVSSMGEIEAISKMSDRQLDQYVSLWEEKNELARKAATEELEPLKAETEAKIEELTNTALNKYTELWAKYSEENAALTAELKQAMIDAGEEGYNEIISQVEDYTSAGEDLLGGIITGIANKSPELQEAVKSAVNQAIEAAKLAAGIQSPSKVMKKEIGYNLADGVSVGWADKVKELKNKMADDMRGITARIKTAVSLEQSQMTQGVGVRDTGFSEVAQAVGLQTAGINSLASEYRNGSSSQVTVPLILDGRELGRAIVDLGNAETVRTGTSLSFA